MQRSQATTPDIMGQADLLSNAADWMVHLRSVNLSPATQETYQAAVVQLDRFLTSRGMPRQVGAIRREHIEAFLADLLERVKPATAANRYRGLQQFWRWLVDEGEIKESPMRLMKPPRVPENPPDVLTDDEVSRLLDTCRRGKSFEDRRDYAILQVLLSTGVRRAELTNLRLHHSLYPADPEGSDFERGRGDLAGTIRVLGKGARWRVVGLDTVAEAALVGYLRARRQHPRAAEPYLWLGHRGPMTPTGIFQMIRRRGQEAGLKLHPHLFRHRFAHEALSAGMQETDLMRLTGWQSRSMVARYAASAGAQRALAAQRRLMRKRL